MGMHQPGWRERNEERATEAWRADALGQCRKLRAAVDAIEHSLWVDNHANVIHDAVYDIDDASQRLFDLRHGPENPDH